jgi:hypothetical protein
MVRRFLHSFDSRRYDELSEEDSIGIGTLSWLTGQRPSSYLNWNDPEDWEARLLFDLRVITITRQLVINKMMSNGRVC